MLTCSTFTDDQLEHEGGRPVDNKADTDRGRLAPCLTSNQVVLVKCLGTCVTQHVQVHGSAGSTLAWAPRPRRHKRQSTRLLDLIRLADLLQELRRHGLAIEQQQQCRMLRVQLVYHQLLPLRMRRDDPRPLHPLLNFSRGKKQSPPPCTRCHRSRRQHEAKTNPDANA